MDVYGTENDSVAGVGSAQQHASFRRSIPIPSEDVCMCLDRWIFPLAEGLSSINRSPKLYLLINELYGRVRYRS